MNEERKKPYLVSSFGGDWPYFGRNELIEEFKGIIKRRFSVFKTSGQTDKEYNLIPFSSTIKGAGKSKANQDVRFIT